VDRRCSLVARMMLRNAEAVPCPSPGFGLTEKSERSDKARQGSALSDANWWKK